MTEHEIWVKGQVDEAFQRVDSGDAVFLSSEEAKRIMEERKTSIRNKKK